VWGDTKDGAFGIRPPPVLDEQDGTGKIVNAEGLASEKQLWGKPSNWCDYSGTIGEERVGWRFSITRRTRAIPCGGTRADTACLPPTHSACRLSPMTSRRTARRRWSPGKIAALPLPGDRASGRCAIGGDCGAVQQATRPGSNSAPPGKLKHAPPMAQPGALSCI